MKGKARIIGTGAYLPKRILTNSDLEKLVDTSDEWIVTRTGMKERRIASDDEYSSNMGAEAAKNAIEMSGLSAEDIDFIIVATLTPDYAFPSTGCIIQNLLTTKTIPALDIEAGCTGYIYALSIAKAYIEAGIYNNILVIASDKISTIVDYSDRSTCVLFGDGAASCVVSNKGKGLFIRGVTLGSDGSQGELLMLPAGGSRNPTSIETVKQGKHFIHMAGNEVFKHAVRRMEYSSKECLKQVGLKEDDISWLIPHQANIRIIDAIAKRFKNLSQDRVFKKVVEKFGNTSAATVGISLDILNREGKIKTNENVLLTAFGSGLTWGSAIITEGDDG